MELYNFVIFPIICLVTNSQFTNFDAQYELIEHYLTIRNLDIAILFTCWSHSDRVKNMKKLNEKKIMVTFRNINGFNFNDEAFAISLHSPVLGIIMDWSCNENTMYQFSDNWIWNASYHWLMMMEKTLHKNIQHFLTSKNINLTISSEVILAYPDQNDDINVNWHIFDIYRTAFEPKGQLMVDILNETFGKWGNRLSKINKRSNLQNLILTVVTVNNGYGRTVNEITDINSTEEIIKFFSYKLERSYPWQKFSFSSVYLFTRYILNMTLNIKLTNSWGFKNKNNKWDGLVGMVMSGEADFSIMLNAVRSERLDVVDYAAMSIWRHQPCFIFRHPRTSTSSMNVFLRPFEITVWFSLIGIIIISIFVYYTIVYFESNKMFSLSGLNDLLLIIIGALCQQGTVMTPKQFSNRLIVFLMFVFCLIIYQFYSSSIVSGLLRPTVIHIDSVQKLEKSGIDVGIEDWNVLTRVIEHYGKFNPYMQKIIDNKIKPNSAYLLPKDGVKKIKKGYYAFFTDPGTTYWYVNDIFTENEKCDLSELPLKRPETTAYIIQKHSPYKKIINYGNNVLLETGFIQREHRIWHAKKPECIIGKSITEESLVSVGIKDVSSLLIFLFAGCAISFTILIVEIIVFHYNTEKHRTSKHFSPTNSVKSQV